MFSLMANCFACIKKSREPPKKVTLVLVGLDNAGKTTAIKGVKGENNSEEPPTVGFSSVEFTFEKKFEVTVYDLGGGKKIRDIWKDYYAEVHGVVFVLDASDEDRIEECRQALKDTLEHHRIHGKRILVLANKQDVDGALDEVDICEQLELEEMVNESKCPCRVETCTAIEGFGKKMDKAIHQGFQWLLHGMADEWEKLSERVDREFTEQKEAQRKYKRERLEQIRKQKEEREKLEKEEQERNGEVEESEDEDVVIGDPFKKVDNDYFEEIKNKKANKKKKKIDKGGENETVKQSKGKSPRLQDNNESQESERTKNNGSIVIDKPRAKKGKKKSPRGVENNAFQNSEDSVVNTENRINTMELDSESEPYIVVTKKKKKKAKKTLVNDEEAEEELELSERKQTDLNVSKSSQFELSQDEDESNVKKKKKKKKKFKKNNKTSPMAVDGIDEGKAPGLPNPLGPPPWANPAGQRNIFIKASKQPTLEPLMEGNVQKLSPIASSNSNSRLEPIKSNSNHNWSLDLPEIPTRRKPNTDDDEDIIV